MRLLRLRRGGDSEPAARQAEAAAGATVGGLRLLRRGGDGELVGCQAALASIASGGGLRLLCCGSGDKPVPPTALHPRSVRGGDQQLKDRGLALKRSPARRCDAESSA